MRSGVPGEVSGATAVPWPNPYSEGLPLCLSWYFCHLLVRFVAISRSASDKLEFLPTSVISKFSATGHGRA